MLRAGGCGIGSALILDGVIVVGAKLQVGNDAFINQGCFLDAHGGITIREGASIGMRCQLVTGTHHVGAAIRRAGELKMATITIGAGAWLGANVTVLPGVSIGNGAIIGAGSVVTRSIPPNSLAVGSPARVVKELDD